MTVTVNIKYYDGWDTKNIKQVEEVVIVNKYIYEENGIFIYLKEPKFFSCGSGNTKSSYVYFLNNNGFVEYYSYNNTHLIEEMCLHNPLNNISDFLYNLEKQQWTINKVRWSNFSICDNKNPIVDMNKNII